MTYGEWGHPTNSRTLDKLILKTFSKSELFAPGDLPTFQKTARKIIRPAFDPALQRFRPHPECGFHFGTGESRHPVPPDEKQADMLPTRGTTRRHPADFFRLHPADPHFLVQLPDGSRRVAFPGIQMPCHAGIPHPGMRVLEAGALLQQQFPMPVDHEHVDRAVQQILIVNLPPGRLPGHLVGFIHHVEHLVPALRNVAQRMVVIPPRQLGGWEGQMEMSDDFDELPAELLAAFGGSEA